MVLNAGLGGLLRLDLFEQVLHGAGVGDLRVLPPREAALTPEDSAELYELLLTRPVSLAGFGQRLVACHLLRGVLEGEEDLPRALLLARTARYVGLAVLRPDGYLASAVTGHTLQRVGPVVLEAGALRAGAFEVGRFYADLGGVWRPVDEQLRGVSTGPGLAEVYDDADVVSRVLDGAQDAAIETALALAKLAAHPLDSIAALSQLPQGVATLLLQSPEYLERFRLMTRGEQIRALSQLTTTVLVTWGAAAGSTRMVTALGRGMSPLSAPALVLSVDGTLALQRVVIPVGQAVSVLGGGPGAAIVLHMANHAVQAPRGSGSGRSTSARGPGEWTTVNESMSPRSARYQEQITGRPANESYVVNGVRFDGVEAGRLLEAKGKGYANKFADTLEPRPWFIKGTNSLLSQAERQLHAAKGVPVRWHVAEKKAADAIRMLLHRSGFGAIEVVHTPALP